MRFFKKSLLLVMLVSVFGNLGISGYIALDASEQDDVIKSTRVQVSEPVIDVNNKLDLENDTDGVTLEIGESEDEGKTSIFSLDILGALNPQKEEVASGEETLKVKNDDVEPGEVVSYSITSEGDFLTNSEDVSRSSENVDVVNEIEVLNEQIVSTDTGIVQTTGGIKNVVYIYPTVDDYLIKENGIPLNGGGYDAEYIGTEKIGEEYVVHAMISGREGYISLNDVQIIPTSLVKSQSHYRAENGEWVYYEATDSLIDDSYLTYAVGQAPDWAQENVPYYSYDDESYTTSSNTRSGDTKYESYSYFQNLPFTSTSNYSGDQYKDYLKHKGKTNSKYYNYTDAFVEAQNKEQVNSLYLFAMANHESDYGTSEFAKDCNNFFGFGAYDSSPDNACDSYGYDTPRDGILAQPLHLKQLWGDLEDWRWAGTQLGNKSHGVNVSYASDSNWGKKIATQMYEIDKYLGGKENNYYKVYEITSTQDVYTSYSQNEKLMIGKSGEEEVYRMTRDSGNPRVIVTAGNSDYFEFQLPTPRNNSSSTTCTFTDAKEGDYPNFEGTHNVKVDKGTASFSCDYGSFTKQQAWYPKKSSSGGSTYNVITNGGYHDPVDTVDSISWETTWPDDNHKITKGYQDGKLVQKKQYEYNSSGQEIDYVNECFNENGKRTYYRHIARNSKGKPTYDNKTDYTSSGARKDKQIRKYEYASNGQEVDYVNEVFNSNNKRTYYRHIARNSSGKPTYDNKTEYTSSGARRDKQIRSYKYASNGKEIDYVNEVFNSNNKRTYYRHIIHYSNGNTKYDNKTTYTSSGSRVKTVKKWYDEDGNLTQTDSY